ncbi:MAG: hypothetical protein HYS60_00650 [Candidatus Wildermuthbacteria bacterium]|nr:hypothetical protein [Candidatus Wildermuthbacteria bacterium]
MQNSTPVQLVFGAVRFTYQKLRDQVAYCGEDGPPFPKEKELVKAQLVVELMDRYRYGPHDIRVDALVALKGPDLHYMEADVLVEKAQKPFLAFLVEAPVLYKKNKDENLLKLFAIGASFPRKLFPSYLIYYTRWYKGENLHRKFVCIDIKKYPTVFAWQKAGFPNTGYIPSSGSLKG